MTAIIPTSVRKLIKRVKTKFQPKPVIPTLTQAQAQFLEDQIRENITELHKIQNAVSERVKEMWNVCDKDNPETIGIFKQMNKGKDFNREVARRLKMYSEIQANLKKIQKAG